MRESVDPPIFIFSSYCEGGQAITVQHSPSSICCAAKIQNSFIYTDVGKKIKISKVAVLALLEIASRMLQINMNIPASIHSRYLSYINLSRVYKLSDLHFIMWPVCIADCHAGSCFLLTLMSVPSPSPVSPGAQLLIVSLV